MPDTLILMVLALVVFGPRRLPKIGRQIGKLMYEFRKASNDFKFQMEEELRQAEEAERRQKEEAERQRALAAAPAPPQLEQASTPAAGLPSTSELLVPAPSTGETPHPGEDGYPDPSSEATRSEESAPPAVEADASSGAQVPTPRIQPPSTGEIVAANHPGAPPQQQDLFADAAGNAPENTTPEAERSEPATHHG